MDWNIERWQIAVAVEHRRVFRDANGVDWIERSAASGDALGRVRLGRKFDPFKADLFVMLGIGDIYVWTEAGEIAFAKESASRNATVTVR